MQRPISEVTLTRKAVHSGYQPQPGVVDSFTRDLGEAVQYARKPAREMAATGAIYGGTPKGVPEVDKIVNDFMVGFLDASQGVPERRG